MMQPMICIDQNKMEQIEMTGNATEKGQWEPLSGSYKVYVTKLYGFTTDTLLLANFAAPAKKDRCADFGTGCGTIPLIWQLRYRPASIVGYEIQAEAAEQARLSVKENGFEQDITIVHTDIRQYKKNIAHQQYDLIACNPPYKAVGAGLQNDTRERTTIRHESSMTLPDLAKSAAFALKHGGRLCVCQRPERLTDMIQVFREHGLEPKRLRFVQQTVKKAPSLFLLEARRGGRSGLRVEPALLIKDENGFTAEMMEIYGDYAANARQ